MGGGVPPRQSSVRGSESGEFRCFEGITTKPWVGLLVPLFWFESFPFVAVLSSAHQVGGSVLPTLRWERLSSPPAPPQALPVSVETFLLEGEQAQLKNKIKWVGEQDVETQLQREAAPLSVGSPPHEDEGGACGVCSEVLRAAEASPS